MAPLYSENCRHQAFCAERIQISSHMPLALLVLPSYIPPARIWEAAAPANALEYGSAIEVHSMPLFLSAPLKTI
eukprot:4491176-Karenia_brevis.AAC.1